VIGFDQGVMVPVRTGDTDSVVVQDTRAIGKRAMENLLTESKGESVPPTTLIEPRLVTRDNLGSLEIGRILHPPGEAKSSQATSGDAAAAEAKLRLEANRHELRHQCSRCKMRQRLS
jgi:ABC-type sugar transport system substrate-binding protein